MSREGSLDAPTRHPLDWRDPDFADPEKLDAEMRRVFDICHGCRRCFNLCDSFPRLFTLIDDSPSGELDGVESADFASVVEACTLCDMCFMTKCPYVPPHPFNLDFPHLMLRYRAAEAKAGKTNFVARQLAEMDRNGRLAQPVSALANFATSRKNAVTRELMEATLGIDADVELPKFRTRTFVLADRGDPIRPNEDAPAYAAKAKAALFATCFVNYNKPETGMAARAVLNHIGVETKVAYPGCCGMPFLEQAELDRVAENAAKVSKELVKLIDEGYDIVTLTASCGLIFKFEWPLIVPDNADVKRLAAATCDIDEYVVTIARKHGLPEGLKSLPEGVTVHLACHARAQNMGPKAAEMLRLIPATPVDVIERCAGHGGTFGVLKETHESAIKVGRPAMRAAVTQARGHIASDCPLAAKHIVQGAREMAAEAGKDLPARGPEHPIEIFARAYGLMETIR
jgi:glycerol-3-phosphate dehydrogenase subunit C